tara:strand:- start:331 stop:735 length:405 start_codon:yes stop_codon:yes gene_type:complete
MTMSEDRPLLTLVKSEVLDEPTIPLSNEEQGLVHTLSTLCSFYSIDDFASFLFSSKFQELTAQRNLFIVFEIGLFLDHTKTLKLMPSKEGLILVDEQNLGVFPENIHNVLDQTDAKHQINHWYNAAYSPENRFS